MCFWVISYPGCEVACAHINQTVRSAYKFRLYIESLVPSNVHISFKGFLFILSSCKIYRLLRFCSGQATLSGFYPAPYIFALLCFVKRVHARILWKLIHRRSLELRWAPDCDWFFPVLTLSPPPHSIITWPSSQHVTDITRFSAFMSYLRPRSKG